MDITLPALQAAVVADKSGDLVVSVEIPLPDLEPGMLLIKTEAVAINPADSKLVGFMATEGATAGSDGAGTVVAVGPGVPKERFAIGDRICAPHSSMNPLKPRHGAFADYATTSASFSLKIPSDMSFETASTLGISIGTIGHALFYSLDIPRRPHDPTPTPTVVLVYGGSTASGTMAIQLIRKSGCIPIATCSPKNFALLKEYGVEKSFDYHDADCVEQIKAYTQDALNYVLDCHCDASSMKFSYRVIGRAGGRYTTLQPYPAHLHTRKRVKPDWILGSALFGYRMNWKAPYNIEANPDLRRFGEEWFRTAQRLLDQGQIRPHPSRISEGKGWLEVIKAIQSLKSNPVSGQKLVVRVA